MSWQAIVAALEERINDVAEAHDTPATTHQYLRWTNDGSEGEQFQDLFVTDGRLATVQITRTAVRVLRAQEDTRLRIQHDAKAEITLALQDATGSELLHQALIDAVIDDLASGDRTLDANALTHTDPRAENIQASRFGNALAHTADLLLTIEEVVGTRPEPDDVELTSLGPGVTADQLAISLALVDWLSTQPLVDGLNLVQLQLDPSNRPHPRYPVDPVSDLPALIIQNHTGQNTRTVNNGRDSIYQLSAYIYMLQTPEDHHQQTLQNAMRTVETVLLRNPRPFALETAGAQMMTPGKVDYPDELPHPLVDDPALRVSVGEILIQITSKKEA